MPVSEERIRLGEERKYIFINFCNLVPKETLAVEFRRSVEQIERELAFVAKKITEYRHQRCIKPNPAQGMLPPIACGSEEEILINRVGLLWTLDFIGPETLSTELILPNLVTHNIDPGDSLAFLAHMVRQTGGTPKATN